ncbi:MAG TPA: FUSC family protein [Solirubrobacteraceae bacterium]|jgi:Fusaric acid resistance protein-like|nr:FUSC family protein [Solirubrobacteraceae bacterium]
MSPLSKVFELNWKGLNVPRALIILGILGGSLIVMEAAGWSVYWVTLAMAALFAGVSDPGGEFGYRATRMGLFAVIGALLTGLGFAIGEKAWELVVLAAFVVTVIGGLAVKYGLHRYTAGYVLNCWFIIAIGLPASYRLDRYTSHTWAQMLAWVAGCALWVAIIFIGWLARGRGSRPQPIPEIPGDISPRKLTRPIIAFSVIRALTVSIAVAIAFGLHLPNAYWMPIATIVAMKSSLDQSALVAEQRLIGATIGAAIASLCLLAIHSKYALEVILVLLGAIGGSIRGVNYTLYAAAIAGCVLIASGVSHHPSNLGAEAQRVLYTFLGVGLALIVMLLVNQLQKRTAAKAPPPQPA